MDKEQTKETAELPPNNEAKEKEKKPSMSNIQLQNQINELKEEANYMENILAITYDEIDTMQNNIGTLKQKIKNSLNNSPMKRVKQVKAKEQQ